MNRDKLACFKAGGQINLNLDRAEEKNGRIFNSQNKKPTKLENYLQKVHKIDHFFFIHIYLLYFIYVSMNIKAIQTRHHPCSTRFLLLLYLLYKLESHQQQK